ncbi:hypothetical protein ACL03H_13505 [Saccharopolyspora sp. MS10]|uniref:hypothetical protein n=1 Tax=Saccharopolyspora sp. MS10 TaxID=3385973 RepID=UPI00399F5C73
MNSHSPSIDDLRENLTNRLALTLPAGWEYAQVLYRALGAHEEIAAVVHLVTRQLAPWSPPPQLRDDFRLLRAAMADGTTGTWLSAKYELRFPDDTAFKFNTAKRPRWTAEPSEADYALELERFPRAPEHVPAWFPARDS